MIDKIFFCSSSRIYVLKFSGSWSALLFVLRLFLCCIFSESWRVKEWIWVIERILHWSSILHNCRCSVVLKDTLIWISILSHSIEIFNIQILFKRNLPQKLLYKPCHYTHLLFIQELFLYWHIRLHHWSNIVNSENFLKLTSMQSLNFFLQYNR